MLHLPISESALEGLCKACPLPSTLPPPPLHRVYLDRTSHLPFSEVCTRGTMSKYLLSFSKVLKSQARNQDFMWGGANEAKVDQTTEMHFLMSDPFT